MNLSYYPHIKFSTAHLGVNYAIYNKYQAGITLIEKSTTLLFGDWLIPLSLILPRLISLLSCRQSQLFMSIVPNTDFVAVTTPENQNSICCQVLYKKYNSFRSLHKAANLNFVIIESYWSGPGLQCCARYREHAHNFLTFLWHICDIFLTSWYVLALSTSRIRMETRNHSNYSMTYLLILPDITTIAIYHSYWKYEIWNIFTF